jgi:tetratricopeptide (TPR) repeat protein
MKRSPFRLSSLVLALSLALSGANAAHAAGGHDYLPDYQRIEAASWQADVAGLSALSGELNALAGAGTEAEAALAAAYVDYRLANAGLADAKHNDAAIDAALERARQRLESLAGRAEPRQAEALAMLAGVYGLQIARSPLKGPLLGMKAGQAIAEALRLAPEQARVRLFAGINKLYTPALFGGDRELAIADFDSVIARLPRSEASAANWGLNDALLWRGLALKAVGRRDEARASVQQVLDAAPQHGWAKQLMAGLR